MERDEIMDRNEIITLIKNPAYDFLEINGHLGENIIFLTLGGSHAYGTNTENSDMDVRGVATNSRKEILLNKGFEQVIDDPTDTTIYSLTKFINLISDCNPNTIELLGCKPEHYIYINPIGEELLKNRKMFLSKRAKYKFGGYATAQLRRLQNALARDNYPEIEKEKHILDSMKNTMNAIFEQYNNDILLYVGEDDAINIKFRKDLDMPIRETNSMLSQLTNIVRDYEKLNHRNKKKDDLHLNKHAMHLVRLLLMGIDIFEKEEIITYRESDHDLLMKIRNGFFQKSDGSYHPIFFDMVADLQERFDYAAENTALPEKPKTKKIEDFICNINSSIISGYVPHETFPEWRGVDNGK